MVFLEGSLRGLCHVIRYSVEMLRRAIQVAMESVMNLQFLHHPRQNKRDGEWRDLFASMGLRLIHCRTDRLFLLFRQATYVLEGERAGDDQLESGSLNNRKY